jgi:hypothetical protein
VNKIAVYHSSIALDAYRVTVARQHVWVAHQNIGMTELKIKRSGTASFETLSGLLAKSKNAEANQSKRRSGTNHKARKIPAKPWFRQAGFGNLGRATRLGPVADDRAFAIRLGPDLLSRQREAYHASGFSINNGVFRR